MEYESLSVVITWLLQQEKGNLADLVQQLFRATSKLIQGS